MLSFADAPFLVLWEVTRACRLACLHCRASAGPHRNPLELTTAEARSLLEAIRRFGDPLLVFTGGDPLERSDLFDLLEHSVGLGLRTTVTPSATPLLTAEAIRRFQQCGIARMAISLDDPDAASHDGFRGVAGSFERTLFALDFARDIGLPTQVNTTVTPGNLSRLVEIARSVERAKAQLWSVFFLVSTGRAQAQQDLSATEYEQVFEYLYQLSKTAPFDIKTTAAPHYRRYVAQQRKASGGSSQPRNGGESIRRQAGINDGKGLLFISHTGEVFPSGFLPVSAGNIRNRALADLYRDSPLFRRLRAPHILGGKCGVCEYRSLCGGSRARAWAETRDYLAEDSRCIFQPSDTQVGHLAATL